MAARKVISRLTHNDATVKITNASADNATIALATDLKLVADTIGTPKVNIDQIMWSTSPVAGSYITITRNSVVINTLYGTGMMDMRGMGINESEGSTYDIVVTLVGTGGTIYLSLGKTEGYGD